MKKHLLIIAVLILNSLSVQAFDPADSTKAVAPATKVKDFIIYQDQTYYATFPSVVKKSNGEYLVAFRRAPDRIVNFKEKGNSHVDPNSYLVGVTSKDGVNWTKEPELIYSHAFGGSQDPCLLQLKDGTLLCASYGWAFLEDDGLENIRKPHFANSKGTVFLGGYLVKSLDGGDTWKGPIYPPSIDPEVNYTPMGNKVPAYNRGALYEGKSGRIFWVVAASDTEKRGKTSNYLLVSDDKGNTWEHLSTVAVDDEVIFNEASAYETPKGDIIAFIRTAKFDDQAVIARSKDGGKTFEKWESMGFQGHPLQALRLPDDRVFLVYGYRHKPYGIRARILNPECTDFATAEEIIIREDGGSTDIGYPWAVNMGEDKVLVTYYFNTDNKNRHIAGTILKIN